MTDDGQGLVRGAPARRSRRGAVGVLVALLASLAVGRPWKPGALRALRRGAPGDQFRRFRVGDRAVYLREDHFAGGVYSNLRVHGRRAG